MKTDHEKDMELIRKEAKAKVPKGWRRVTRGMIRPDDMYWNFVDNEFVSYKENVGTVRIKEITRNHYYIIRKMENVEVFTIVFEDDADSHVGTDIVEAKSPTHAAKKFAKAMTESGSDGRILAIFEGKLKECMGFEEGMRFNCVKDIL